MAKTNIPHVATQVQARQHLQMGITRMADALAPTLGPAGTPVVVEGNVRNKVELIDDAATVARRIISLGDPRLDIGAMIVRNVVWRVSQRAGDGGATAAVLLNAILQGGLRQITAGANAMQLVRGIRLGMEVATGALLAQARPCGDESQLAAAARTVTRDDDLSAMLGEMSYLLGPDAPVQIETYVAPYLQREYVAGAVYKARISSAHFYTESERKRAAIAAPAVALVDYNITTAEQAVGLLNAALQAGRTSILIVAPDVSGAALQLLVANHAQPADKRKIAVLATTITLLGEERTWAVRDLALLSGATILGTPSGRTAEGATPADLGTALRAEFNSEKLAVIAEPQHRAEVQEVIAELRSYLDSLGLDDEGRPAAERRLAALSGGMGVLKVGDVSKLTTEMRKNQAERTFKVLSAVQRSGLVAGAGAAYVHCQAAIRQAAAERDLDEDVRLGMRVLADALSAPMRRLLQNAGVEPPTVVIQRVVDAGPQATYGWEQQKVVDAHAAGVVDAADVLVTVLQSATSGAIMALSTDAVVYHKKPQQSLEP
ncbi:MAG: TCP-1/cpn60 chaperonin family protein [Caldilineaceae bacterium]